MKTHLSPRPGCGQFLCGPSYQTHLEPYTAAVSLSPDNPSNLSKSYHSSPVSASLQPLLIPLGIPSSYPFSVSFPVPRTHNQQLPLNSPCTGVETLESY